MNERICAYEGCGKLMQRNNSDDEYRWRRRRFCCVTCANKARKGMKHVQEYRRRDPQFPAARRQAEEYVEPPYNGLLGYHNPPPEHIAAAVAARLLKGALR